jgi:hypothetical protein
VDEITDKQKLKEAIEEFGKLSDESRKKVKLGSKEIKIEDYEKRLKELEKKEKEESEKIQKIKKELSDDKNIMN